MTAAPWIYGVVALLAVIYPLVALYAYRASTGPGSDDTDGNPPAGRLVSCPECGVENERDYRFCRSCVSELPGTFERDGSTPAPTGRGIL